MRQHLLVMVIEDHDGLRQATVSFLNQNGFDAEGIPCAEDLDDVSLQHVPALYVIDISLPGEDGLSLARRLRRSQPLAGIVITTARGELDDRLHGYAAGADIYLAKPVDPHELLATLSALTHRLTHQRSDHQLTMDCRKGILLGVNGPVSITASEVRLLASLSAAVNHTLERWQVAACLHPESDGISADNLQNRISQLRKKIQSCGVDGPSIKSLRGHGYVLAIPLVVI